MKMDKPRTHLWCLGLVLIVIIAVYAPTVRWLLNRWTMSVWHHGHGILILLAVIYLIWIELKKHRELQDNVSAWGFAILIPALMIHILDAGISSQFLSAFSLFLALPGLSLLFLGTRRTKAIIFPLLILFLTLPIPLFMARFVHLILRDISSEAVAFILPFIGIPVFLQGTTLQIAAGHLDVADACSGFSTLYASVTIACLVAYYCQNFRRKIIIIIIAAPLAIVVNIMRIILLCVLVSQLGTDILNTNLHDISGMITFVIVIPIIFWLGNISNDTLSSPQKDISGGQ